MSDKNWLINFTLPQLSASHYYHGQVVQAANLGLAVNRAWSIVKKKPAVKGRRIEEFRIQGNVVKDTGE